MLFYYNIILDSLIKNIQTNSYFHKYYHLKLEKYYNYLYCKKEGLVA